MRHAFSIIMVMAALLTAASLSWCKDDTANQFDFNKVSKTVVAQASTTEATPSSMDKLYIDGKLSMQKTKLIESFLIGIIAVVSLYIVLRFVTGTPSYNATHVVNGSALVLIIFGTILTVVIADAEQQITAAIGILGGIAGYLFGTMHKGTGGEQTPIQTEKGKMNSQGGNVNG